MSKISKRYKKITEGLLPESNFDLKLAVKMLKEKATVKFSEIFYGLKKATVFFSYGLKKATVYFRILAVF